MDKKEQGRNIANEEGRDSLARATEEATAQIEADLISIAEGDTIPERDISQLTIDAARRLAGINPERTPIEQNIRQDEARKPKRLKITSVSNTGTLFDQDAEPKDSASASTKTTNKIVPIQFQDKDTSTEPSTLFDQDRPTPINTNGEDDLKKITATPFDPKSHNNTDSLPPSEPLLEKTSDENIPQAPTTIGTSTASTELTPIPSDKPKSKEDSGKIDVHIVNISDQVRREAQDIARSRLTADKNDPGEQNKVRRTFKRIFMYGYFEGYYFNKYFKEELTKLLEEDSNGKTVERFESGAVRKNRSHEYEEDVVGNNTSEEFKKLMIDFSLDKITPAAFDIQKHKIISQLYRESSIPKGRDSYERFEDNISKYIDQIKLLLGLGKSEDDIRELISIKIGLAKDLLETKGHLSGIDRTMEKLRNRNTRLASIFPSETSIAVAIPLFTQLSKSALESRAIAVLSFGSSALISTAYAGFRENQRMKRDRQLNLRQLSSGEISPSDITNDEKRRQELQPTLHSFMSIPEKQQELDEIMEQLTLLSAEDNATTFDENKKRQVRELIGKALVISAEFNSRVDLSILKGTDLLAYSSPKTMQEEFQQMYSTTRLLDNNINHDAFYIEAVKQAFEKDIRKDFNIKDGIDITEQQAILYKQVLLNKLSEGIRGQIENDLKSTNKEFNSVKNKRVLTFMGKNLATGLLIGGVVSAIAYELISLRDHAPNIEISKNISRKIKESLSKKREIIQTKFATFDVPKGVHYTVVNSQATIFNSQGKAFPLNLNREGLLTQEAISKMRNSKFATVQQGFVSTNVVQETQRRVNLNSYLLSKAGSKGRVNVERSMWWDNNNKPGVNTQNELGIHWGSDSGYTKNGDVVFNIMSMTNSGSFEGTRRLAVNRLIQSGNIKCWISATRGTQATPYTFNVSSNGNIIIPKDSPVSKLFTNVNGHAVFHGAFVETVQTLGRTKNGTVIGNPIATYIGGNNTNTLTTVIKTAKDAVKKSPFIRINPITPVLKKTLIKSTPNNFIPLFIPAPPRRPLEYVIPESNINTEATTPPDIRIIDPVAVAAEIPTHNNTTSGSTDTPTNARIAEPIPVNPINESPVLGTENNFQEILNALEDKITIIERAIEKINIPSNEKYQLLKNIFFIFEKFLETNRSFQNLDSNINPILKGSTIERLIKHFIELGFINNIEVKIEDIYNNHKKEIDDVVKYLLIMS